MLAIAAGAALAVLFWPVLRAVAALVAGAAALAFLLAPLCRRLEGALGAGLAASACLLGLLILLAALLWLLAPALIRQAADLISALPAALQALRALGEKLSAWLREVGLENARMPQLDMGGLGDGVLRFAAGTVSFAGGVANAVSQISMAAVLSAFLLIDRKNLLLRLELCVPLRLRATAVRMGAAAGREVRLYLRAQAMVSLAVGALSALGLWLAGVRSALALGLLVGLFNLIPYFGPVLGGGADFRLADGGLRRGRARHRTTTRRPAHFPAGDGRAHRPWPRRRVGGRICRRLRAGRARNAAGAACDDGFSNMR